MASSSRSASQLVAIRPPARGLPRLDTPDLRGMTRAELAKFVGEALGGPSFRADQVFEWLHRHRATTFEAMTNLPAAARATLAEKARIEPLGVNASQRGRDGTRKLQLSTSDGAAIECVLIPNEGRGATLCVSSMVGCSLTCRFCATASLGFVRNLAAAEIVDQVYRAQDHLDTDERLTNLVFMGMGEPLHNYGQLKRALAILTDPRGAAIAGRRVTVSSAGLVPAIVRFARDGWAADVGLAISLNATTDAQRDALMPINRRWNIAQLLRAVQDLPSPGRRRLTFEYVLLAGVNDSDEDATRLVGLVRDLGAQVNAIPYNPHSAAPFARPTAQRVERFVALVRRGGVQVHVRTPRGDDIDAACGQLAMRSGVDGG